MGRTKYRLGVNLCRIETVGVIGGVDMSYNMVNRGGHIEGWDECGRFVLSADTIGEAKRDLDELEKRTSSP